MECYAHKKGCGGYGGGQDEGFEVDIVASAGPFTLTTERRKKRGKAVQRHGEEICYVEEAGYAGPHEGLEGGGGGGGEAIVEDGVQKLSQSSTSSS